MAKGATIENFNTWLFLAVLIAFTTAAGTVMAVYGYMDETQTAIDLRVGDHSSMCLHARCWGPQGSWGSSGLAQHTR
jgi:hypothetical protein